MWRIAILAGIILTPYFTHQQSWQASVTILELTFAFGGMLSALFAILCRKLFAKGSLNGWDKALVFAAVSRLAHATA